MSKQKTTSAERAHKRELADRDFTRLLYAFVIAVCAIMGFIYIKNKVTDYIFAAKAAIIFVIFFGVLLLAAIANMIFGKKYPKDDLKVVRPVHLVAVSAYFVFASALYFVVDNAYLWNIMIAIALFILYCAKNIYGKTFFIITAFAEIEALIIYVGFVLGFAKTVWLVMQSALRIAAFLLPAAFIVSAIFALAKKSKKKKCITVFDAVAVFILSAVSIVASVLILVNFNLWIYALIAFGISYLVLGIINAVRAM